MKKKILVSLLVGAMMMMALPMAAFAAPSPSGQSASADGATVTGLVAGQKATIAKTSETLPGVTVAAGEKSVGTWDIVVLDANGNPVTEFPNGLALTFAVGAEYNGMTVKVHQEHNGTMLSPQSATVKDGAVTITVTKLSKFQVVADTKSLAAGATANASAKSPQTGFDMTGVMLASGACILFAGAAAFALKKKLSE
ncbi:MAG: hypothetical protein RR955_06320 [Raoultibacter sp.]